MRESLTSLHQINASFCNYVNNLSFKFGKNSFLTFALLSANKLLLRHSKSGIVLTITQIPVEKIIGLFSITYILTVTDKPEMIIFSYYSEAPTFGISLQIFHV
jgi:hypothetical protein